MLVIKPDSSDIFEYPYTLSQDDSILIRFTYRPPVWTGSQARIENKDLILPTVFNGFQYLCTSGGISGVIEPSWPLESKATIHDGSATGSSAINHVIWKAEPYDYLLMPGQNITASTWEAIDCTLLPDSHTSDYTEVQIGVITPDVSSITLINTITYSSSDQVLKRAILIPIKSVR